MLVVFWVHDITSAIDFLRKVGGALVLTSLVLIYFQSDFWVHLSEADLKLFSPTWDHSMNSILRNPCHSVNFLKTEFSLHPSGNGVHVLSLALTNVSLCTWGDTPPLHKLPGCESDEHKEVRTRLKTSSRGNVALVLRLEGNSAAVPGPREY